MQRRRFGRTGLDIPALTFGGGWVGGLLIHSQDKAAAALDRALEAGMDWIDTAAMYGDGVSETVIGRWLAGRTERPRLSTKFRLDTDKGDYRGQMLRSVEASLDRLGLDKVEVIILHNTIAPNPEAGARELSADQALEVADVMETLRDQGLCHHLGMTALGDPESLHAVVGTGRFDVAQVYYNMLNATAMHARVPWNSTNFGGLLQACSNQDMGIMGIRIFAAGHLASTQRHGREIPITESADDAAEEARATAVWSVLETASGAPAQAAVRFGLECEALSTIVVGLGEPRHLELAIEAEKMGPLPPEQIAAIHACWDGPAFTQ